MRQRIKELAERFREKGATSPDRAMTIQELGLPPRFEQAMKKRLGATGIFVEVGGRYYLDEARIQQFEQMGGAGGQWRARRNMLGLRIARMAVGLVAILLILTNIFFLRSIYVSIVVVALVLLWVVLTIFQFYYLSRMWRRRTT